MQELWDGHRAEARCSKAQTSALCMKLRKILSYASAKRPDDIQCLFPTLVLGKLSKQRQKQTQVFQKTPWVAAQQSWTLGEGQIKDVLLNICFFVRDIPTLRLETHQ